MVMECHGFAFWYVLAWHMDPCNIVKHHENTIINRYLSGIMFFPCKLQLIQESPKIVGWHSFDACATSSCLCRIHLQGKYRTGKVAPAAQPCPICGLPPFGAGKGIHFTMNVVGVSTCFYYFPFFWGGVWLSILVGGFKHEFYFPFHIWDNPSHWLICFKMVKPC